MLHHHRQVRHGGQSSPETGYTDEEIAQFNQRHDQTYGWSITFQSLYTNPLRLPESYTGPARTYLAPSPKP